MSNTNTEAIRQVKNNQLNTKNAKEQTTASQRDVEELMFYRQRRQQIQEVERKLKETRDNLHAMMCSALGKRKKNDYANCDTIEDFITAYDNGKKLFHERPWYKKGKDLIRGLNSTFDDMVKCAKSIIYTNYDNTHSIETLQNAYSEFHDTYKYAKNRSKNQDPTQKGKYFLDGNGLCSAGGFITYSWNENINYELQNTLKHQGNVINQ